MSSVQKYLKYKKKYNILKNKMMMYGGNNGILYITIGIPSSGKTTLCKTIVETSDSAIRWEADIFP